MIAETKVRTATPEPTLDEDFRRIVKELETWKAECRAKARKIDRLESQVKNLLRPQQFARAGA